MTRNKRLVCLAVTFALLALAGMANAEPVTFTLVNGTGDYLVEFYASPPNVGDWEEDILGDDTLAPGERVQITIADGREDCEYDFLAVFEDDNEEQYNLEHDAIEICGGETYVYE